MRCWLEREGAKDKRILLRTIIKSDFFYRWKRVCITGSFLLYSITVFFCESLYAVANMCVANGVAATPEKGLLPWHWPVLLNMID